MPVAPRALYGMIRTWTSFLMDLRLERLLLACKNRRNLFHFSAYYDKMFICSTPWYEHCPPSCSLSILAIVVLAATPNKRCQAWFSREASESAENSWTRVNTNIDLVYKVGTVDGLETSTCTREHLSHDEIEFFRKLHRAFESMSESKSSRPQSGERHRFSNKGPLTVRINAQKSVSLQSLNDEKEVIWWVD